MAVVPDPHFNQPGNKQTGEAVTPIGTKYRMLFPVHAPFFTTSLVVKSGGKTLKLGDDYVITHPYMVGMSRTGYLTHGAVWITNDKYTNNFTMDYHAVGIAEATASQIAAEREANKDKYPTAIECQWDAVVGDVYFPPVDIQFDWENWRGELELMQAIAAIGTKIGQLPPIPDPYIGNRFAPAFPADIMMSGSRQYVNYDNQGGYVAKNNGQAIVYLSSNDYLLFNFKVDTEYNLSSYASNVNAKQFWSMPLGYLGTSSGVQNVGISWDSTSLVMRFAITIAGVEYPVASFPAPKSFMAKFRVRFDRNYDLDTLRCVVTGADGSTKIDTVFDFRNPPSNLVAIFAQYNVLKAVHRGVDFRNSWYVVRGDTWKHNVFPGMAVPDGSDVLTLLKHYHSIVDALYRNAPAHAHIPRVDNPHRDIWGAIRALEQGGIASDATLVYGKNQSQLADYVNTQLPKLADLANKLLRMPAAPQAINGTFGTKPGLTSVTSAVGTDESNGVGAQFTVDAKVIRFLGRDSTTVNAGNNAITFQSGANQLILYPDSRGLLFNGKKLLDPTTVAPYLPGNEGGGDGLFYGTSTATVTINGNGIQSVPFICQFVPPTSDDLGLLVMRKLATDFGTAEDLAATPALIAKLDAMFTGKLVKAKSYVNDLPLTGSIYLDKTSYGLDQVQDIPDTQLLISTLQQAELDKYAVVGHSHQASAFGIDTATDVQFGLVKYSLAVDDATLALDGGEVIRQTTSVTEIEGVAKSLDSGAAIDIIRFGPPGTGTIEGGATFTGWMLTIKAGTYFVGQEYTVPLTTINLTEAFPGAYEDVEMGIYVDVQDNAAVYRIFANKDTAETDTMTAVGIVGTSEDEIVMAEVHSVTRLGDFRELEEHIADDNAHIKRTMTQAEFGFTYGTGGPVWRSGIMDNTRGEGDWRGALADGYYPMGAVQYDDANGRWTFRPNGTSVNDYRFIHNLFPMYLNQGVTANWLSSDTGNASMLESIMAGWHDDTNFFNRLSIILNRGYNITDTNGDFCYAGFALNYGRGRNVVIGFTGTKLPVGGGAAWSALNPRVYWYQSRNATGITITGYLILGGLYYDFTLTLSTTEMTLKVTTRATGDVQTVDLSSRIRPDYIDIRPLINNPELPIYHGFGGMFGDVTTVAPTYSRDASMVKNRYYATFLDYMINYSALNRVRFAEYNWVGGSVTPESLADSIVNAIGSEGALVDPNKVPLYANADNVIAFNRGGIARAVIIRD
ncbi:hypothetical protein pEaSNUABM29_00263 [Erwinia phage pEa_SNUABM_29]|nr:hypothetical protein pEaSNUABM29_00263 [Erwinia phage pEa_SNUABM_29]